MELFMPQACLLSYTLTGNLHADNCPLQSSFINFELLILGGQFFESFLGAAKSSLGTLHIDLFRGLSSFYQNDDPVITDFEIAPVERHMLGNTVVLVDKFTNLERGQKRCMTGQNAEFAQLTGSCNFLNLGVNHFFIGGD